MSRADGAPVVAVDCGTNTVRLLVAGPPADGAPGLRVLHRESRIVRLGKGVDATGRFSGAALARTLAALDDYAAVVARHGVPAERVRFCATSATRDAADRDVLVDGVRARLGVEPEVVGGEVEAALAGTGALRALPPTVVHPARPALVVDVGGGSTELVRGRDGEVGAARSMDVGGVRLHERHRLSDPPTGAEVAAVRADVDDALDRAGPGLGAEGIGVEVVVGCAATALTVAAVALGLDHDRLLAVDAVPVPVPAALDAVERLRRMRVTERRALPFVPDGRADVLGAGALVLGAVLERSGAATLVPSVADVLDGIAWSVLDRTR